MTELEEERVALSQEIRCAYYDGQGITTKQLGVLNTLLSQGLSRKGDRDLRLSVVRVLVGEEVQRMTGYSIDSTKQIPCCVATILINQLKAASSWQLSQHGLWLIMEAEKYAQRY